MLATKKNRIHYAYKILILCCCLSASVNGMFIHCKGVFYKAAAQSIGVNATKYATFSIYGSLISVLTTPFVTKIFNRKSVKRVLCVYLFLFFLSVALLSCAKQMWQCYAIGVLQGITGSFLTVYPVAYLIRNWFTKNRGMATGISTMTAGLFSTIMNLVLGYGIQRIGWRNTYFLDAIIAFFIAIIPVLLFAERKPEDIGLEPFGGISEYSNRLETERVNARLLIGILPFVFLTASFYVTSSYNQHLPNFAQDLGLSATFGASLISVCMFGNTFFKLILGYLNDKLGVYKTSLITTVSMAISFGLLAFQPISTFLLYVVAIILGQSTAFIVVQIPLMLSDRFVIQSEYETCLSSIMITGSIAGAINIVVIDVLYTSSGSYKLGHFLCCLLLVVCTLIVIYLLNCKRKFTTKNKQ